MKINDLLTCLIISLASTGELNLPLHIYILQLTQHQEGLLSLHRLPLVLQQNLQPLHWPYTGFQVAAPALQHLSVHGQHGKPPLPPFFPLLTSFCNHSAIHLHPQEVPWGHQPGPHIFWAASGKISLHSGLENSEDPPKISLHSHVGPDSVDPGMRICRWSGNTGAVGKSTVKEKLLGQEGL